MSTLCSMCSYTHFFYTQHRQQQEISALYFIHYIMATPLIIYQASLHGGASLAADWATLWRLPVSYLFRSMPQGILFQAKKKMTIHSIILHLLMLIRVPDITRAPIYPVLVFIRS